MHQAWPVSTCHHPLLASHCDLCPQSGQHSSWHTLGAQCFLCAAIQPPRPAHSSGLQWEQHPKKVPGSGVLLKVTSISLETKLGLWCLQISMVSRFPRVGFKLLTARPRMWSCLGSVSQLQVTGAGQQPTEAWSGVGEHPTGFRTWGAGHTQTLTESLLRTHHQAGHWRHSDKGQQVPCTLEGGRGQTTDSQTCWGEDSFGWHMGPQPGVCTGSGALGAGTHQGPPETTPRARATSVHPGPSLTRLVR